MFGLGMPEILLILAIALIVIGPKKLPELAKTLGRAMGEFKRSAQDFKRSIDMETTLHDVTPSAKDLNDVSRKSRREKTDKDKEKNSENPDSDKNQIPPDEPLDDLQKPPEPENDVRKNGGTDAKKADN
jgi:Tat protein translocase TatB subunit